MEHTKTQKITQKRVGLVSLVLGLVCLIPASLTLIFFLSSSTGMDVASIPYPQNIYALLRIITPFAFSIVFIILGIRTFQEKLIWPIESWEDDTIMMGFLLLVVGFFFLFMSVFDGPDAIIGGAIIFLSLGILTLKKNWKWETSYGDSA